MTPQMEPLWRWSPRVEPREDTMKEKKEREKEWGKEKNNYTVRESVSMKVRSPSVYRESVLSATRSRWKFILSTYRTRARNYRAPRKTYRTWHPVIKLAGILARRLSALVSKSCEKTRSVGKTDSWRGSTTIERSSSALSPLRAIFLLPERNSRPFVYCSVTAGTESRNLE